MRRPRTWEETEPDVDFVHAALRCDRLVAPVAPGDDEARWADCDLASLAENRLGDRTDPRTIDEARRGDWRTRATTEPTPSPTSRGDYETCYWLLDGAERAGTIAVARTTRGGGSLRVSSLYVFPPHRGRGVAKRVLLRLRDLSAARDLGVRLDTHWSWQRTLRFYMGLGMWVRRWKRDLDLQWVPGWPDPATEVGPAEARLWVARQGQRVVLAGARRDGDWLLLEGGRREGAGEPDALAWEAPSTFALALALYGWPLIRSPEAWERCRHSDAVAPEALAYRITIWEAWDRDHGWRVETPRIPGLDYPTWQALAAP